MFRWSRIKYIQYYKNYVMYVKEYQHKCQHVHTYIYVDTCINVS